MGLLSSQILKSKAKKEENINLNMILKFLLNVIPYCFRGITTVFPSFVFNTEVEEWESKAFSQTRNGHFCRSFFSVHSCSVLSILLILSVSDQKVLFYLKKNCCITSGDQPDSLSLPTLAILLSYTTQKVVDNKRT